MNEGKINTMCESSEAEHSCDRGMTQQRDAKDLVNHVQLYQGTGVTRLRECYLKHMKSGI